MQTHMARSRNWVFTLNNYTEEEEGELKLYFAGNCIYAGWGREVGENGTPHLQGLVVMQNAVRLATLRSKFSKRAHWEPMRGTFEQAKEYCKKDGLYWCWGQEPVGRGARSDIKSITDSIVAGATNKEILMEHGDKALRMLSGITTARAIMNEVKRDWVMDVRIYWGPPGVGKSRAVWDEFGIDHVYTKMNGKWWDGYAGETCVIIDDFDPANCFDMVYDFYLKLMDRYPMRIEWKGGSGQFYSKAIVFTSNMDPAEWFPTKSNRGAFFRRVSEIRHIDTDTDTEVVLGNTIPAPPPDPLTEWLSGAFGEID